MTVSEYQPAMKGRVLRVSYDKRSANVLTITGRVVVLDRGNNDWCGLCVGQMVNILNYNRNASLFGQWEVVEAPPMMPEKAQWTETYEPPPAPRQPGPEPVRPPMPDPKKLKAERFAVAPTNVPFRDLRAEREDLRAMNRGR